VGFLTNCVSFLRRGRGMSEFRRDLYARDLWVLPLADITGIKRF